MASRRASVRCAVSSVIRRSDSGRKPSSSSSLSVGGWPFGEVGAREVADAPLVGPLGLAAIPGAQLLGGTRAPRAGPTRRGQRPTGRAAEWRAYTLALAATYSRPQ